MTPELHMFRVHGESTDQKNVFGIHHLDNYFILSHLQTYSLVSQLSCMEFDVLSRGAFRSHGLAFNTAYPLDRELGPQSSELPRIPVSAVLGQRLVVRNTVGHLLAWFFPSFKLNSDDITITESEKYKSRSYLC